MATIQTHKPKEMITPHEFWRDSQCRLAEVAVTLMSVATIYGAVSARSFIDARQYRNWGNEENIGWPALVDQRS